jgi:hypothetical protein
MGAITIAGQGYAVNGELDCLLISPKNWSGHKQILLAQSAPLSRRPRVVCARIAGSGLMSVGLQAEVEQ